MDGFLIISITPLSSLLDLDIGNLAEPFPPGYPHSTLDGSGVWIDPDNNLFGGINDCKIDGWHRVGEYIRNLPLFTGK